MFTCLSRFKICISVKSGSELTITCQEVESSFKARTGQLCAVNWIACILVIHIKFVTGKY